MLSWLLSAAHFVIQPHIIVLAAGVGLAIWLGLMARVRLAAGVLIATLLIVACLMFQGLQAQLSASQAALAHARSLLATAQSQARINQSAMNEADHTEQTDRSTRAIVADAQRGLIDAADRADAHALYVAWVDGIRRLRDDRAAAA